MIKYMIIGAIALSSLNAQEMVDCDSPTVKSGDILQIVKPSGTTYKFINLPRPNFLIKRGGIANFNKLNGEKVEITEVRITENCNTQVVVKRQNSKKFFNTLNTLSIELDQAVEKGEVRLEERI